MRLCIFRYSPMYRVFVPSFLSEGVNECSSNRAPWGWQLWWGETRVGSVCMSTSVHKSRHRSPWCCWRWTSSTINSMFIMFHRLIGGRVGLTHSQTDTHAAFYIRISYKLANCQMEVVGLLYWLFENNKVRFIYQWLLLSEAGAVAGDHGDFRSEFSDVDWDPWWSQDPWWVHDAKLDLTCPREALQAII